MAGPVYLNLGRNGPGPTQLTFRNFEALRANRDTTPPKILGLRIAERTAGLGVARAVRPDFVIATTQGPMTPACELVVA
jgi:hypothetical protein